MATSKSGGSTSNNRDSNSKRLGVKKFGGELATAGAIIIRQRGTKFHPGNNVGRGGGDTLYAECEGTVNFKVGFKKRMYVSIIPAEV